MHRRTFCNSALGAAIIATLPGCGREARNGAGGGNLVAVTGDGAEISIEAAAVAELGGALDGALYRQSDPGYDGAKRVWNGMFDERRPALVVQCLSTQDVVDAVTFAREHSLLVSVKCGGHSLPGKSTCDGGMMIDLSQMHGVDVDAQAMTARVDGGSLLGHLDGATLSHNLLTTTGIVSHTGIGGYTLGGGLGRTDRKMGLAIDNLLAATVVTAGGDIMRASEDENADLFWAIRGGGGNFGVATEFVYRLHPVDPVVYGGDLIYPIDREFLTFFAELNETLPDEANVEPNFFSGEDGLPIASVEVTWCGDHAAGEKAFAPMLAYPGLKGGTLGPLQYRELQTRADSFLAYGKEYYLKSGYLTRLTPDAIEVMVDFANRPGAPASWFQHLGGASARVAADATAYVHRAVDFNFGIMYIGTDPSQNDSAIAAVREYYSAMAPHMAGYYTNLNDESEQKTWGNYGSNYPRLAEIKGRYDPGNLFRLNANILPASAV